MDSNVAPSIVEALRGGSHSCVEVRVLGLRVGEIIVTNGRLAWATSADQQETLGSFLECWGHIKPNDLKKIQELYAEHGREKRLASILEDAGLLERSMLRNCLLHHVRSAVESLLDFGYADAAVEELAEAPDDRFLFEPEEILPLELFEQLQSPAEEGPPTPQGEAPGTPPESGRGEGEQAGAPPGPRVTQDMVAGAIAEGPDDASALDAAEQRLEPAEVFQVLGELRGFRAAALFTTNGQLLQVHGLGLASEFFATVAGHLSTCGELIRDAALGDIRTTLLECTAGQLAVRRLEQLRHHLLVLLTGPEADAATVLAWMTWGASALTKSVEQLTSDGLLRRRHTEELHRVRKPPRD